MRRGIIFFCTTEHENLARHKPTWQSSTAWGGFSPRAVDGNHDPRYEKDSCAHTGEGRVSWWIVDLQYEYLIQAVQITLRDMFRKKCFHLLLLLRIDFKLSIDVM